MNRYVSFEFRWPVTVDSSNTVTVKIPISDNPNTPPFISVNPAAITGLQLSENEKEQALEKAEESFLRSICIKQ